MTRYESKHVAHVSMVVDIAINCCVRLLHLVPILLQNLCATFYNMRPPPTRPAAEIRRKTARHSGLQILPSKFLTTSVVHLYHQAMGST